MKKKIWLFSKSKEGRKLLHIKKDILVVLFQGSIRFSTLLTPKNFPQSAWNNVWADIFIQAFGIYDGTKNFMIEHLNRLFTRIKNPSLSDLFYQIKNTKYPLMTRYARYQESAINRLGGILNSPISNAIDCRNTTIEFLTTNNVVFEIQYLTAEQQVFIVNILLSWIFYLKLYNNIEIIHFAGVDDGNLVFDSSFDHRPDRGLPIISHLLSTVRKSGIVVICCSQIPHQLGSSIHSNCFTKIMFSLSSGKDIECMIQSMGITDADQRQYCYQLAPQEMIVKFSARYQEPFLAYVPFTCFPENEENDEEIKINNKRIMPFFTEEKKEKEKVTIHQTEEKDNKRGDKKESIPSDLKQFLFEVYNHPFYSITQHYSNLNLSAGKGNRIVKSLISQELCKIVEINLGGRGGSTKFMAITEQGYKAINMTPLKYTKGTNFMHFLLQNKTAENLKKSKNNKVAIEANLKGKFIDILVEQVKDDRLLRIAIEISITSTAEKEKENIVKDLESGADFVIVACEYKEKLNEINEMIAYLEAKYKAKTYSCLLTQLLRTDDLLDLIKSKKSI